MIEENKEAHLKKVHKALIFLADKLNSLNIKWLLGGSGALMVHGIDIVPWDLDILATPENVKRIVSEFATIIINPDEEELTLNMEGIDIEVIKLNDLGSPIPVSFKNVSIPVNTLRNELNYYRQRPGKEETIKLIEEKLATLS